MSKKAKIIGVNMVPFKKPGTHESYEVMAAHAVKGGLEDAGIDYSLRLLSVTRNLRRNMALTLLSKLLHKR